MIIFAQEDRFLNFLFFKGGKMSANNEKVTKIDKKKEQDSDTQKIPCVVCKELVPLTDDYFRTCKKCGYVDPS